MSVTHHTPTTVPDDLGDNPSLLNPSAWNEGHDVVLSDAEHGARGSGLHTDAHSNANDPSAGQKAALAGTSGTPGAGNLYVTDADARNTNARTPAAHTHSHDTELTGVSADDHHAQAHVLATGTALGADHTISGAATGEVLRALTATTAAFDQLAHADLGGITATDHHVAPAAGPDANVTVDAAGAAGTASTFARSAHGHQVVTTDAPSGANITVDAAAGVAATGAIARAAHGHRLNTSASNPVALGAAAPGTSGNAPSRDNHVHPTTGLALDPHGAAQHTDVTRALFLSASGSQLDVATLVSLGASPNLTKAVAYADAATQGAFWTFAIPSDWASGVITVQPIWSPGSTDAVAHTVRWSMTCKNVAAGTTITAAGTTVAFTGSSAARTVAVVVFDTATSTTVTPAAANNLFTIELQRIGADAADTYVGVVNLLGLLVTYTANQ